MLILSLGTILLFLTFPDRFRLDVSQWIFVATAAIILMVDVKRSNGQCDVLPDAQTERRIENLKVWMLFASTILIQFGFIHEHIFGPDFSTSSLYSGVFTHGGYMPYTDNAQYLIGVQAFLNYGLTISMSVFRPEGMYWSALLFKLTGGSMTVYFYFQAVLSSIAILSAAISLRRMLAWPWVLLFTWLLSAYAGLLQGTFITELTSFPFAVISLALLVQGWTESRRSLLIWGVALLALAFEMRPAVFLFAPFIFILLGWPLGSDRRFQWKTMFLSISVYILTVMCNRKIISALEYPPVAISNTYGKLYQIYKGSEAWNEVNNVIPPKGIKDANLVHVYKQNYVHQLILNDAMPLVKNYLVRLSKVWMQPQKLFEVIHPGMSSSISILLLSFILFGFIMHRGRRALIMIHGLIVCYMVAAIFSLPFLHAELRVMSVTQPVVILAFVLAIFNAFSVCLSVLRFLLSVIHPRESYFFTSSGTDIPWYERGRRDFFYLHALAAILFFFAMITPLLLDSTRSPVRVSLQEMQRSTTVSTKRLFLLDVRDAPQMHFDPLHRKVSLSPPEMPIERIRDKWVFDPIMHDGFYLFNAINHLDFKARKSFAIQLVIPDRILTGLNLQQVDALLLEGIKREEWKGDYVIRIFLAQRVVSLSTKHNSSSNP